jgi:hypothetical protein
MSAALAVDINKARTGLAALTGGMCPHPGVGAAAQATPTPPLNFEPLLKICGNCAGRIRAERSGAPKLAL